MASAICIDGSRRAALLRVPTVLATVLAAMLAAPLTARAQSSSEKQAQALQVEGLRLMQKGDNRHALEKFDEAFQLVPSPRILFNRGKAHHALGDDVDALADFERFLDEAPFAPKESRDEATRVVEKLRPKLAYLDIQAEDPGSEISVDGHTVGTAPLARPVVVARGKHEIKATKSGMNDDVRSVSVIPGQKLRVAIRLTAVAERTPVAPAVVPAAPVEPAPVVTPVGPAVTPPVKPPEPPAPAPGERPWQITAGWVAAGASALFLGAGITAQLLSASKSSDFNAVKNAPSPDGTCNQAFVNDGGGPCQGLADAAHQRKVFAIVGYVAAGVAAAGSVALFLSAPSQPAAPREVAAACSPTAAAGFSCALQLTF
jgi:hypothetical protein